MRRDLADEVEFQTLMWFDSLDAIITIVGKDYSISHVPFAARDVLSRFDERGALRSDRPSRAIAAKSNGCPSPASP